MASVDPVLRGDPPRGDLVEFPRHREGAHLPRGEQRARVRKHGGRRGIACEVGGHRRDEEVHDAPLAETRRERLGLGPRPREGHVIGSRESERDDGERAIRSRVVRRDLFAHDDAGPRGQRHRAVDGVAVGHHDEVHASIEGDLVHLSRIERGRDGSVTGIDGSCVV